MQNQFLEISIAFQSWVGSGQIRMRNKENKETFDKIITQLKTKEIKNKFDYANIVYDNRSIVIGHGVTFVERLIHYKYL